jgi:hypothetical protein
MLFVMALPLYRLVYDPNAFEEVRPLRNWCPLSESNGRPTAYKAVALPSELSGRMVVDQVGIEPTTFSLQSCCSPN